jgi:rhodanese-related sulfurtransferase
MDPRPIGRDAVRQLVASEAAQLVEVLPRDEYDEEHLPDAIHLPLKSLTAQSAAVLDTTRPVIVYCWDRL